MDKLMNNLYLYELVLLFLGVFLFMILCLCLLYYVKKGENIKKLLLFFMLPIIMIGYPSIQEINIEGDKLAIKKYKEQIKENPNDSIAIEETKKLVQKLEGRANTTEDLAEISEAYLLIEKPDKAILFADKAIKLEEEKTDTNKNITRLKEYKEFAKFQKEVKSDIIKPSDTLKIKKRLNTINKSNVGIRQFIDKKYTLNPKVINSKTKN